MRTYRLIVAAFLTAAVTPVLTAPAYGAAGWSVVTSANSTAEDGLAGVSIVSSNDVWAVGSAYSVINGAFQERPLIEHYAGSTWKIVTSPAPAGYPYVEL